MSDDKLVYMANQIAANFASMSEAEAVAATAEHIRLFWSRSMKSDLQFLRDKGGAKLSPVALRALEHLAK